MKKYKETNYLVTKDGRVWTNNRNRFLTLDIRKDGYVMVKLSENGHKTGKLVHRLVAETYILNPDNYRYVNHINNDRGDNRVENLEWCSAQMNSNHMIKMGTQLKGITHKMVKLTEEQVLEIRRIYSNKEMSHRQLAKTYNVCRRLIATIVNRIIWRHI